MLLGWCRVWSEADAGRVGARPLRALALVAAVLPRGRPPWRSVWVPGRRWAPARLSAGMSKLGFKVFSAGSAFLSRSFMFFHFAQGRTGSWTCGLGRS